MPNIGFWATAGAGGALSSDFELIQTVYGTGSSGSLEFSSIPQTYKHLQLRIVSRITGGGDSYNVNAIRLNGAGGGYDYQVLNFFGEGSTVLSTSKYDSSYVPFWSTNYSSDSNRYGGCIIEVPNYTASFRKSIRTMYTNGTEGRTGQTVGNTYNVLSAVTSIQIFSASGGSFTTSSRFSLYGMK